MKHNPSPKQVAKTSFAVIGVVLLSCIVGGWIWLSIAFQQAYQDRAQPVEQALASVQLPTGYAITEHHKADAPGPVGNFPIRVETVSVPSGRTQDQVKADFGQVAPAQQTVVERGANTDFSFWLSFSAGNTVKVIANPVTGASSDPVTNITVVAQ